MCTAHTSLPSHLLAVIKRNYWTIITKIKKKVKLSLKACICHLSTKFAYRSQQHTQDSWGFPNLHESLIWLFKNIKCYWILDSVKKVFFLHSSIFVKKKKKKENNTHDSFFQWAKQSVTEQSQVISTNYSVHILTQQWPTAKEFARSPYGIIR